MSKINNDGAYAQDGSFSDKDFLIGSNGDTRTKATKTYSLKNMQNYLLSGLAPLIGGTMRTTEIVYDGDEFTTYAQVLNNLDPTYTVRQYHNIIVSIKDVKGLLKPQDREVGIGCVPVLDSDFINFPIDFSNVYASMATNMGLAEAMITEEREIRVGENFAMATLIETVSATVETNKGLAEAMVQTVSTAMALENEAMASRIDTVSATVTTNKSIAAALVQSESTARATADTATATRLDTVSATVTTNDAAVKALITSESTARATADTATASRIDSVSATVNTNDTAVKALITSEATARANADSAMSSRIDTVSASIVDPTAEINAAVTLATSAAVTREQAISSSVNTVSAKVNANEAKITTAQTAIVDINGQMAASYNLSVDVNGKVAGMKLGSNGVTSSIAFTADSFKIFNGTNNVSPFTVVNGNVIMTGTTVVDTVVTNGTGPAIGATGWNGLSLNRSNDNSLVFRHPNGVLGMEIGIIAGVLTLNWYNDQGNLVWQGGQNGITYVTNIPQSWTATYFGLITLNQTATDQQLIDLVDSELGGYNPTSIFPNIAPVYLYSAGTNSSSAENKIYEGYQRSNTQSSFIDNGIYAAKSLNVAINSSSEAVISVRYITDGKITRTRMIYVPNRGSQM